MTSASKESTAATSSRKIQFMVEAGLLIAVTLIMGLTPLGTIRTPFLSASIVTVPVAIAAMLIGPWGAFICATVFGLTSLFNAVTGTSGMLTMLMQVNPFGVFVTAVVARMLMGICDGFLFKGLKKLSHKPFIYYLTGLAAPLLNTFFFMSSIIIFFYNSDYIQGIAADKGVANPIAFVIAIVGVQGLIEAIVGCAIGGTVGHLVARALHRVGG